MSSAITFSYDTSKLSQKFSELLGALYGTGKNGDVSVALKTEAASCAKRIADALGPGSKSQALSRIDKDVRQYLTAVPKYSNLSAEQQESSYADFTWLQAGKNFVVGINNEDDQRNTSADEALRLYYSNRKAGSRGPAKVELGQRGKKNRIHVLRVNRLLVKPSVLNSVKKSINSAVGQSKAAWASTYDALKSNARIPAWIRNQIPAVRSNGKAVLDESGMGDTKSPSLVFGSRAKGVESNPVIRGVIQGQIDASARILQSKAEKIISGQSYNWNTGQVFRPTTFEEN